MVSAMRLAKRMREAKIRRTRLCKRIVHRWRWRNLERVRRRVRGDRVGPDPLAALSSGDEMHVSSHDERLIMPGERFEMVAATAELHHRIRTFCYEMDALERQCVDAEIEIRRSQGTVAKWFQGAFCCSSSDASRGNERYQRYTFSI